MTTAEFSLWCKTFRETHMRPEDDFSFLPAWFKTIPGSSAGLDFYTLDEALEANAMICRDPRICEKNNPASFVRNRLPMLLEILSEIRQRKEHEEQRKRFLAESWRNTPTGDSAKSTEPSLIEQMRQRKAAQRKDSDHDDPR